MIKKNIGGKLLEMNFNIIITEFIYGKHEFELLKTGSINIFFMKTGNFC